MAFLWQLELTNTEALHLLIVYSPIVSELHLECPSIIHKLVSASTQGEELRDLDTVGVSVCDVFVNVFLLISTTCGLLFSVGH